MRVTACRFFSIASFALSFFVITTVLFGQANMPGVENSVGYLSSGTSIEPRTTSESSEMIHKSFGAWTAMVHANAFLVDVQQTGPRGKDKLFSTNWLMPMLHRQFGRQGLVIRTMLSFEPATITQRRYPLLFQTGETAYGLSIVDGQHPHDLFMELAARYDLALGERSQIFVYGGPVGEAALGPTAYPHRASASENPLAVIGHHLQDSTHIATNVISVGLAEGPIQIEASTFNGREPDENRWNIGRGKPDSFSTRLTIAPFKSLSGQFSAGRVNQPELTDPGFDTIRTTASLHYNRQFAGGHMASSLIWGRNKNVKAGVSRRIFNSYNFETTVQFARRNWVWTRIENVDRDRSLLPPSQQAPPNDCLLCGLVGAPIPISADTDKPIKSNHVVLGPGGTPVLIDETPIGRIQAYTVGYEREVPLNLRWLRTGLGIQATTYTMPPQLRSVYGDHPATVALFIKLRPAGNMQEHMRQMHQ